MNLLQRARQFAQWAHRDHARKYTGVPYATHLERVAAICAEIGMRPEAIAAAWLHDTIEDTEVTEAQLLQEFGPEVTKLVVELTKITEPGRDGNRATRKEIEAKRLAAVSDEAQTIKLADLADNAAEIIRVDPKFARVFVPEAQQLLELMDRGDKRLAKRLEAVLAEYVTKEERENVAVSRNE